MISVAREDLGKTICPLIFSDPNISTSHVPRAID